MWFQSVHRLAAVLGSRVWLAPCPRPSVACPRLVPVALPSSASPPRPRAWSWASGLGRGPVATRLLPLPVLQAGPLGVTVMYLAVGRLFR